MDAPKLVVLNRCHRFTSPDDFWVSLENRGNGVEYILASEHARIVAEKDAEIARLLKAISAIATWMDDPEWREHIGAVRGARSIARTAAIRALKESPDA